MDNLLCDRPDEYVQEVLVSEDEIRTRVMELGQRISEDYRGKDLVLVCMLKGAMVFISDLMRNMSLPVELDCMAVSSYGNSTISSGELLVSKDLGLDICGKHVLIVEDIVDTGHTLCLVKEMLERRNPASLKVCTLLDKPDRRKCDVVPDYNGFTIEDKFVVGYGLDYAERLRNLPYIGVVKDELWMK